MRMICMAVLFAVVGAVPAPAAAEDISDFLRGRWGSAQTDWSPADPVRAGHHCARGADGKDSALRFSGKLADLKVESDINRDSPGPVVSAVTLGEAIPAKNSVGAMQQARIIVGISFSYRGLLNTQPKFSGHLGILGPDRIILYQPGAYWPWYLVRCPA